MYGVFVKPAGVALSGPVLGPRGSRLPLSTGESPLPLASGCRQGLENRMQKEMGPTLVCGPHFYAGNPSVAMGTSLG